MAKKLAFAIDTNTPGGAERVMVTLANYMARKGHDVTLINSDSSSFFYEVDPHVTVLKMGVDKISGRLGRLRRSYAKFRILRRWLAHERPDALVTFLIHMEVPAIFAGLATGTRTFASLRNNPRIHLRSNRIFRYLVYPHITGVVIQSDRVRNIPELSHVRNVAAIPNPLPVSITRRQRPVPFTQRTDDIIVVGRLTEQKNPLMALRAFARIAERYPSAKLIYIGKGHLRSELERTAAELNISERVVLAGVEPNPLERHHDARLFVLASDQEGFPNVLAESLAYGIPTISTDFDTGVARDLIEDGISGWLVPVRNEEALAATMDHALSLGPQTDVIAQNETAVFERLNAEHVCALWEKFLLGSNESVPK